MESSGAVGTITLIGVGMDGRLGLDLVYPAMPIATIKITSSIALVSTTHDPSRNTYIGNDGLRHECTGDEGNAIVVNPAAANPGPCVKTNVTNLKNACPM